MELFHNIINDKVSGSGILLKKLENELLAFAVSQDNIEISFLYNILSQLRNKFPQFALFQHFIKSVQEFIENKKNIPGIQLVEFIQTYQEKWKDAQDLSTQKLLGQLSLDRKNILLHSNSSSIHCLMQKISESESPKPIIWQTLSSPMNEGKIQAVKLSALGFDVRLFHEDAISKFLSQIDMAIFGADYISENFFINKTGTFFLSLMLKHFQKPVYVLAEKRKVFPEKEITKQKILEEPPKDPDEIAVGLNNIKIYNYYFEPIPLSLIDKTFM